MFVNLLSKFNRFLLVLGPSLDGRAPSGVFIYLERISDLV